MPTLLEKIGQAKGDAKANDSFINAVYKAATGRDATKGELDRFRGKPVGDVSNIVLRDKSPFKGKSFGTAPGEKKDDRLEGLSDEQKELFTELENSLKELKERGGGINPNIEITPKKAAEFLKQAEREINPFFQGQLKLARDSLLTSVGFDKKSIELFEQDLEQKFERGFRQVGEGAAETGFALSGQRVRQERELTDDTQRQVDEGRRVFHGRQGELAKAFAQRFGGSELPQNVSIGATPTVTDQGFTRGGGDRPVYQLSPKLYDNLIGSDEFRRRGLVKTRQAELESAFRTQQEIDQQRRLTI